MKRVKEKNKVPLVIGVVLLALIIISVFFYLQPPAPSAGSDDEFRACIIDAECVRVSLGCGCTGGGFDTAINARYQSSWYDQHSQPELCPAVVSVDPACGPDAQTKCINNKCELMPTIYVN